MGHQHRISWSTLGVVTAQTRYWREHAAERHDDGAADRLAAGALRLMAAATLRGGVPDALSAADLCMSVRGPEDLGFLRWLAVHHRREVPLGERSSYLAALDPEPIGQELVCQVIRRVRNRRRFLAAALAHAHLDELTCAFATLARIGGAGVDGAREWIRDAIACVEGSTAVEALYGAALCLDRPAAEALLEAVLASDLPRQRASAPAHAATATSWAEHLTTKLPSPESAVATTLALEGHRAHDLRPEHPPTLQSVLLGMEGTADPRLDSLLSTLRRGEDPRTPLSLDDLLAPMLHESFGLSTLKRSTEWRLLLYDDDVTLAHYFRAFQRKRAAQGEKGITVHLTRLESRLGEFLISLDRPGQPTIDE